MSSEEDIFASEDDASDFSETENRKPVKTVKSKPSKVTKNKAAIYDEQDGAKAGRSDSAKKALASKFEKLTPREHVLKRPDTYVGSVESITQPMWVLDGKRIVEKPIAFVPALYKIFDEILVNAADNKRRDATMKEIRVDISPETGRITIRNDGKGIPVEKHEKHGIFIPEMIFGHLLTGENFNDEEQRVVGGRNGYGAKLANIFSSTFRIETNDKASEQCYSQEWTKNMEVCGKAKITKAKAKDYTEVSFIPDYARFGMSGLDADTLALFKKRVVDIAGVTDKTVKVYLNGELVACNTFEKYVKMYVEEEAPATAVPRLSDASSPSNEVENGSAQAPTAPSPGASKKKPPVVFAELNERWQIAVTSSRDATPMQVSFVNSICTYKGGQHVQYLQDRIVKHVMEHIEKKHKAQASVVKPQQIKSHLWLFVNALIVNPSFDSQTKENLTTRPTKFGPKEYMPEIKDDVLAKIVKQTGIVENVLYWASAKQMKDLKRVGGKKKTSLLDIPKLDDANNAGGKHSDRCTLILTEGDSAKTLALSGISVVGRDDFGVFPLKGKLLNVREAGHAQIMKNMEIQNLMRIIGLKPGVVYDSTKDLRYGHVMIMTDQDQDGSHIKGLVFNFFHFYFPSLLAIPGFLQVFATPIVKASKRDRTIAFYSLREYEEWKVKTQLEAREKAQKKDPRATEEQLRVVEVAAVKSWHIKYYKGLGTNTPAEAREYFSHIDTHSIEMKFDDRSADALDMAFSKSRVDDRKTWLLAHDPGRFKPVDFKAKILDYRHFVDGELVLFSLADNVRSIPSMMDGFKPSQRKVLFGCLKRKLVQEIKVSQLSGYVSEHAAYHHGEESLSGTIVNMAQSFVGSNNVPLLHAGGAFGTRRLGGKDSASPRYIFTKLLKVTRVIFNQHDDALLKRVEDDGMMVEPKYYAPIIPMLLVNGSSGIGTGWSTEIPSFNPRTIIDLMRRRLRGSMEPAPKLVPYFKGFTGDIVEEIKPKRGPSGRYFIRGKFELIDEKLYITELPVGKWTGVYKEFLVESIAGPEGTGGAAADSKKGGAKPGDKSNGSFGKRVFPEGAIKEIRENHTDETVAFELTLSPEFADQLRAMGAEGIMTQFQLQTTVSTSNMHAFDHNGMIRKFETPEEILQHFYTIRLPLYTERKNYLEKELAKECEKMSSQARFVKMIVDGSLVLSRKSRQQVVAELQKHNFPRWFKTKGEGEGDDVARNDAGAEDEGDDEEEDKSARGYDYLLSLTFWSLTSEKLKLLEQRAKEKASELEALQKKRPEDLWLDDLDELSKALDELDEIDKLSRKEQDAARGKRGGKGGKGASKRNGVKRARVELSSDEMSLEDFVSDEDDLSDDDDEDFGKKKKPKKALAKPTKAQVAAAAKKEPDRNSSKPIITSAMVPVAAVWTEPEVKEAAAGLEAVPPTATVAGAEGSEMTLTTGTVAPPKPKVVSKKQPVQPQRENKAEKPAKKPVAKKTVVRSSEDEDDDDDDSSGSDMSEVVPAKERTKRAAASKKRVVVEISDEEDDLDVGASPTRPKKKALDEDDYAFSPEALTAPSKGGKQLQLKKSPKKKATLPVAAAMKKPLSLREQLELELAEEEAKKAPKAAGKIETSTTVAEKSKPTRAAAIVKKYVINDSDEDSLLGEDDDEDDVSEESEDEDSDY